MTELVGYMTQEAFDDLVRLEKRLPARSSLVMAWDGVVSCPFHKERTPSARVRDGLFHCGVCKLDIPVALSFRVAIDPKKGKK